MELNKIYQEPCLTTLSKMENNSIDCVITSPPYWQLRDYGYTGQWGLEPTFNEYLENLWCMMDEIYRVLKPSGTVWINLGDSYSTQSGTNLAISKGKHKDQDSTYLINRGESGNLIKDKTLPNKCLLLIPHRFAIGCIERGYIMRNDVIWAKRNGMPESVTDRFSKKHEYFFFMVKSEKYFFDLDAIRDKHIWGEIDKRADGKRHLLNGLSQSGNYATNAVSFNEKGKNPGSVSDFWDVCTKPSSHKHYASYNDELLKKPILAGCPIGGIVYDPFMGTGSTAEICVRTGRNYIGSEMSKEYCDIADKRLNYQNKLAL
jgi:DNA modification methylase